MKRYNLSQIMKRAHNLYNNARAKYPTFSDALRKSWSMAKFEVRVAEERQAIEAETKAREAKVREENEQAAISSVLLRAQIEADRIRREAEAKAEEKIAEGNVCWGDFEITDSTAEEVRKEKARDVGDR